MPGTDFCRGFNCEVFPFFPSNGMDPFLPERFLGGKHKIGDFAPVIFAITFLCTVRYAAMRWHFPLLTHEFTIEK